MTTAFLDADKVRPRSQLAYVRAVMLSHHWLKLAEIVDMLWHCYSVRTTEASVSARLRDLRKLGYLVERERLVEDERVFFRYRVSKP